MGTGSLRAIQNVIFRHQLYSILTKYTIRMTEQVNPLMPSFLLNAFSATKCKPIVRENDERISLRFDFMSEQSAMYKQAPYQLVFSYTRLMMGFLLMHSAPRDILIIGLGGGSLSKYCYRHLPNCRVTTVEISDKVIALRKIFAIPSDNERFRIVHSDGADFIEGCHNDYDVILLDGFDTDGLSPQLSSQRFYNHCALALRQGGVLVANLLEGDPSMRACVSRLHKVFENQVLGARSDKGFNQILYAIKRNKLPEPEELQRRAIELGSNYDLDFRAMALKIQLNGRSRSILF
jgi:spermidine synthase